MSRIILILLTILCYKAMAATPSWSVTPSEFSNSMVMVGVLQVDGIESPDANDMVAAFVNGQVRGVANVQYEATADRYIAYLIVYANQSSEDVTFKVYDASADVELDAYNTLTFVINSSHGNIGAPYIWSNVSLNTGNEITSFDFPESIGTSTITSNSIDVNVNTSAILTALTASFTTSAGAKVTVDDVAQVSGQTSNDFVNSVTYQVTSEDGQQLRTYTVTASSSNDPPTAILLSANTLDENNSVNDLIGLITATDDDSNHTFSLTSGVGDGDNGSFVILGNELRANAVFGFETKNSFSIRLKVEDGAAQTLEHTFEISINDVSESPTDVMLSNSSIAEHISLAAIVGQLTASDEDNGETFTYALSGTSADNDSFLIDSDNLITNAEFNFEVKSSYSIEVTVTDAAANTFVKALAITILDQNDAPTNITLDNQSVFENLPLGTLIGNLSATDEDAGDNHSYSLIAGAGDTNNSDVLISGAELLLKNSLDFETTPNISIRLNIKDGDNATFKKSFTISVLDANDKPTDLTLSNNSIAENAAVESLVGVLSVVDTDPTITTFSLVSGQNDNALFTITDNQLLLGQLIDFETQSLFTVDVIATDEDNQTVSNSFTILATDVNESPTDVELSNQSIGEHATSGTVVAQLSASDEDNGETFTYALSGPSADNDSFLIDGDNLMTNASFNFELKSSYSIEVTVTDAATNTFVKVFTIAIVNENDAPTDMTLGNQNVLENLPSGTLIGNLSTNDEDDGDNHSYSLIAGTGDTNNSDVLISGSELLLKNSLDFETTPSISIRLKVKDGDNATFKKSFTISVLDANDKPTDLTLSNNSIAENVAVESLVGVLSVVDTDPTTTTFSFVSGQNDNALFTITDNQLLVEQLIDFETQSSFTVGVIATDEDNQTVSNSFTILAIDVNESPTDIKLSNQSIKEHATSGTLVGEFSTTDEDSGEMFSYELSGTSVDNNFFLIDSDDLITNGAFNYEEKSNYSIEVTVTDAAANTFVKTINISIHDENDAPTDLVLDNQSVLENLSIGSLIGSLSASDEDVEDVQIFTLISGDGDTNNSSVLISGTQLLVNDHFDFESQNEVSIRVEMKDASSSSFEKIFVIDILDSNDPPTDVLLSNVFITENSPIGSAVGMLSTIDVDPTATVYSFVEGENDNDYFIIDGSEISLTQVIDFESQSQYFIDVVATDVDDQSIANRFTVQVVDENESPIVINPIGEINKGANTDIELSIASVFEDVDSGDELVLSAHVPVSTALPAGVLFDATNKKIILNSALTLSNFELVLTATDLGGLLARDTIAVIAEIVIPLGFEDHTSAISIFPNPVGNQLNLIHNGKEHLLSEHVNIWDLNGKLISPNSEIVNNSISVNQLEEGVYLLELNSGSEKVMLKFIKADN